MEDREKLIELIKEAYCPVMGGFGDEEKVKWLSELDIVYNWEEVADHLIANGVVVQEEAEWILTDGWRCSRCLSLCPFTCDEQEDLSNYCPNCGKKMKEVKRCS